jgi:hypothetical protein
MDDMHSSSSSSSRRRRRRRIFCLRRKATSICLWSVYAPGTAIVHWSYLESALTQPLWFLVRHLRWRLLIH